MQMTLFSWVMPLTLENAAAIDSMKKNRGTKMNENVWKPGLPPGEMTRENKQWFLDTYEVFFSPAGAKWHRKRVSGNQ